MRHSSRWCGMPERESDTEAERHLRYGISSYSRLSSRLGRIPAGTPLSPTSCHSTWKLPVYPNSGPTAYSRRVLESGNTPRHRRTTSQTSATPEKNGRKQGPTVPSHPPKVPQTLWILGNSSSGAGPIYRLVPAFGNERHEATILSSCSPNPRVSG